MTEKIKSDRITGEDLINDLLNHFGNPRIASLSTIQTQNEIFRLVGQGEVVDYLERKYDYTRRLP